MSRRASYAFKSSSENKIVLRFEFFWALFFIFSLFEAKKLLQCSSAQIAFAGDFRADYRVESSFLGYGNVMYL